MPATPTGWAVRGVWRDSLAVSLLCAPFIILVGYFTDDYRSSTVHVGICLLAGLVLRVLSGCLVWLPHKMMDVSLMGYALMGGFLFTGMIGLDGSSMVIITLGCQLHLASTAGIVSRRNCIRL